MGELLRHSDTAMYQAKDRGRNNFQLFSPSMDRRLKERIAIESSLRTALQSRSSSTCTTSRSSTSSRTAWWRSRRCCAGSIRPRLRAPRALHRPSPRRPASSCRSASSCCSGCSRTWRAGARRAATLVPVAVNVSAVQLQRSNLAETHRAPAPSSTALEPQHAAGRAHRERGVRAARGPLARGEPGRGGAAARAGRAHRHRRLRHRLLEPVVPQALARRLRSRSTAASCAIWSPT